MSPDLSRQMQAIYRNPNLGRPSSLRLVTRLPQQHAAKKPITPPPSQPKPTNQVTPPETSAAPIKTMEPFRPPPPGHQTTPAAGDSAVPTIIFSARFPPPPWARRASPRLKAQNRWRQPQPGQPAALQQAHTPEIVSHPPPARLPYSTAPQHNQLKINNKGHAQPHKASPPSHHKHEPEKKGLRAKHNPGIFKPVSTLKCSSIYASRREDCGAQVESFRRQVEPADAVRGMRLKGLMIFRKCNGGQ